MSQPHPPHLPRRSFLLAGGMFAACAISRPSQAGVDTVVYDGKAISLDTCATIGKCTDSALAFHFKTLDIPDDLVAGLLSDQPDSQTVRGFIPLLRQAGAEIDDLIVRGVSTHSLRDLTRTLNNLLRQDDAYLILTADRDMHLVKDRLFPADGVSSIILRSLAVLDRVLYTDKENRWVSYCRPDANPDEISKVFHVKDPKFGAFLNRAGIDFSTNRAPHEGGMRITDAPFWDADLKSLFHDHDNNMMQLRDEVTSALITGIGRSAGMAEKLEQTISRVMAIETEAADYVEATYSLDVRNSFSPYQQKVSFIRDGSLTLPAVSVKHAASLRL